MDKVVSTVKFGVAFLIYPGGQRRAVELSSLRDLYWGLRNRHVAIEFGDTLPQTLILKDGRVIPYVPDYFYQAFVLDWYSEPALLDLLEYVL